MLVSIGRRNAPVGLLELLLECHVRIRSFLRAAERVAASHDVELWAAAAVAADVHRYFSMAFPLHIADEDQSLALRLRGVSAEVDQALATTQLDHHAHQANVDGLVKVCSEIQAGEWNPRVAARLARVTAIVAADLAAHLELEERVVFPAIAALGPAVEAEILAEIRARRDVQRPGLPSRRAM